MNKIFFLIFFVFIVSNNIFAAEIVKLPKDTSSGYKKLFKSLTGSHYKNYGIQLGL
jgi:hypothetical protein